MKTSTKKIIIIILASLSILACIFKGTQAIIQENTQADNAILSGSDREEILSIAKTFYGDAVDEEKLNQVIENSNKINYKTLAVAVILDVILIILAVKNPVNNRNSIAVLGIFASFLTPTLIGLIMGVTLLVTALIPAYDKLYQKQTAPPIEPVNTCKTLAYIILFTIAYIFFYCGIFSLMFRWLNLTEFMANNSALINAVMFSLMFVIVFLMLRKEIIRDVKLLFKNFSTYLNIISPIFFIGFIAQIVIGILLILITKSNASNQAAVTSMPLWFLIIFALIIGPAVEECFFRGFLRKFLKNNVVFVLVSSLLFSVMHVIPYAFFNPIQWLFVLQYATIAVPISILYVKTNNLAATYLFHLCWNAVSLVATAIILL